QHGERVLRPCSAHQRKRALAVASALPDEKSRTTSDYRCEPGAAEADAVAVLPMASPWTMSSTRRLPWRPSAVLFEADGCVLPKPRAVMEEPATPCFP